MNSREERRIKEKDKREGEERERERRETRVIEGGKEGEGERGSEIKKKRPRS